MADKNVAGMKRKLIQLYAALLYNANIKGYIEGTIYTGSAKAACVPGLNCYSCPAAVGACPLGALQNALASANNRAPWYVLGILLLFGVILGRTICGWLCPVGLGQELLYMIPTPKLKKSRITRAFSWLKYAILGIFVIVIPVYYGLQHVAVPAFCKYICPAGTLEGAVSLLANPANSGMFAMLGKLFTNKLVILILSIIAAVFIFRVFCRFICPLGAIYSLFNRFCLASVRVDSSACNNCGACVRKCKMDIRKVGDRECINCGQCIPACPRKAITFNIGSKPVVYDAGSKPVIRHPASEAGRSKPAAGNAGNGKKGLRYAIRIVAAAFLIFVLLWFNFPGLFSRDVEQETAAGQQEAVSGQEAVAEQQDAADQGAETAADVIFGCEVGQRLPDFTITTMDSRTFTLSDYQGKTVILNIWATWCGPCVNELPYFDQIYSEYQDTAAVLAIHSDLITDDVSEFLSNFDFSLPIAVDETGDIVQLLGATTMLPQTVVIDKNGIVTYNSVGSVTYEKLEEFITG